ncbi:MAG: flavin reductase family protein [Pseudomonadota bacterium]|nr:flavin reductase family protein [Pseudomonadota bacterium]
MRLDFARLTTRERSKLLTATVVPRPIALVTSRDAEGVRNAAPISFFNCLQSTPPLLALGFEPRGPGAGKDSWANIQATGRFIVHLVDEPLAEAMNVSAMDFGPEVDELTEAGLETTPGDDVDVPRILAAPVAYECRLFQAIALGDANGIALGEILGMHIRDDLLDVERMRVDTAALAPLARLHNPGWYARATDLFQIRRLNPADWTLRGAAEGSAGSEKEQPRDMPQGRKS